MFRGYYTVASGMIAQQRRQELLANNIANQTTPGYKQDRATMRAFPEMLLRETSSTKIPTQRGLRYHPYPILGSINTGTYMQEGIQDHGQGDLRETGLPTDLALWNQSLPDETGNVFFTVQNDEGDLLYTRNGNFTVDAEGALVTSQGYYVLDANEEPVFTNGLDFDVLPEGMIRTIDGDVPIGLTYVENVNDLVKEGDDLFRGEASAYPAEIEVSVLQGKLEQSNVNALQAMTEMMESYRSFEMNQRILKAFDESMEKAVNEIGRIG